MDVSNMDNEPPSETVVSDFINTLTEVIEGTKDVDVKQESFRILKRHTLSDRNRMLRNE